ncbi:MAG TPA: dihydrodipicolinate reductase C-terminal domain-containing protein, partial [Actinomycetota bacterium]|nr:dihydrodipicolinate reductase C-terminal domain-containing protein [Actinomycetota bacterium]
MISVCVAGATGWTGSAVAEAVIDADDLRLASAVARRSAGTDLGEAWGREPLGVRVHASVADALEGVDVLVDYTSHQQAREIALTAIEHGVNVVIGSSGLTSEIYAQIDDAARERNVGVVAAGNFSLTAAMAQAAALLVARHLPQWEIVDYASATKPDVPSGTARELADRLGEIRHPEIGRELRDITGPVEARGATVSGSQVHSVRLPSFTVSTEVVFGL